MSQWAEVPQDPHGWGEPAAPGQQPTFGEPTWDAATDDDSTPFGGVAQVDGLVYSDEAPSPELQWQPQTDVPMPPVRQRPEPMAPQRVEPWKPGPDPKPVTARVPNPAYRILAVTTVPLLVLAGFGWLVLRIMNAYGL